MVYVKSVVQVSKKKKNPNILRCTYQCRAVNLYFFWSLEILIKVSFGDLKKIGDSRLLCVKNIPDYYILSKPTSFQYRNKPGLCIWLSAATIFASLVMCGGEEERNWFTSVKPNLGTVCDSSAYGHFGINPFCLYLKRKLYLLRTSFFFLVILVCLTLVW